MSHPRTGHGSIKLLVLRRSYQMWKILYRGINHEKCILILLIEVVEIGRSKERGHQCKRKLEKLYFNL